MYVFAVLFIATETAGPGTNLEILYLIKHYIACCPPSRHFSMIARHRKDLTATRRLVRRVVVITHTYMNRTYTKTRERNYALPTRGDDQECSKQFRCPTVFVDAWFAVAVRTRECVRSTPCGPRVYSAPIGYTRRSSHAI